MVPGFGGKLRPHYLSQRLRSCSSSDPKDRVFAILSLVEPAFRKLIPVDYSKDVEWINTAVFVAAIIHYQNLDVLSQIVSTCNASEPFSWVPDWTSLAVDREPIDQLMDFNIDPQ